MSTAAAFSSYRSSSNRADRMPRSFGADKMFPLGLTTDSYLSPVTLRPRRDSSLSYSTASSRASVYVGGGSSSASPMIGRRVSSLTTPGSRASVMLPNGLGSETAKYNREEAIKEIHSNFEREFEENSRKYHRTSQDEEEKRMSRARSRLLGNLDDHMTRKDAVSDMYLARNQFSSRTVATVSSLKEPNAKRREDYKWRKEMEEFENSADFKRESTIRNISSRYRKRREKQEAEEAAAAKVAKPPFAPQRAMRAAARAAAAAAAAADDGGTKAKPTTKRIVSELEESTSSKLSSQLQQPSRRIAIETNEQKVAQPTAEPQKPVKKEETTRRLQEQPEETVVDFKMNDICHKSKIDAREKTATTEAKSKHTKVKKSSNGPKAKSIEQVKETEGEANNIEIKAAAVTEEKQQDEVAPKVTESCVKNSDDNEDEHGTKKMKSEFDAKMEAMEAEMAAGRGKLAKLRERIRKAKGAIQDADEAIAKSTKA